METYPCSASSGRITYTTTTFRMYDKVGIFPSDISWPGDDRPGRGMMIVGGGPEIVENASLPDE